MSTEIELPVNENNTNEPEKLPRYNCKRCVKFGRPPIYFDEQKQLIHHLQIEHIAKDEHDRRGQLLKELEDFKKFEKQLKESERNYKPILKAADSSTVNNNAKIEKTAIETPQPDQLKKTAQKRKIVTTSLPIIAGTSRLGNKKLDDSASSKKRVNFKASLENITNKLPEQVESNDNIQSEDLLKEKLNKLSQDKMRYFNFTMTDIPEYKSKYENTIDELKLSEQVEKLYEGKVSNKIQEIAKDRIVWAQWRFKGKLVWWPSKVENVSRKNSKLQIAIKYFEHNKMSQYSFKMDLSKIELFFRSVDEHFNYKTSVAEFKEKHFEFLSAYTMALKEFDEFCKKEETFPTIKTENETTNNKTVKQRGRKPLENIKIEDTDKILIDKKLMTLDEIKEYAAKEPSMNQIKVDQDRIDKSKILLDKILSPECQKYIESILKSEIECQKSVEYLNGDAKTRKALQQISPGPLIDEHQIQVSNLLIELSKTHFKDKPSNMINYEHDILYPEAVIWAIRKRFNMSAAKALEKFKDGFKRTAEEILKQKCNEYLNSQQLNLEEPQMQEDLITEKSIDLPSLSEKTDDISMEQDSFSLNTQDTDRKDESILEKFDLRDELDKTDLDVSANNNHVMDTQETTVEHDGSGIDL